MIQNSPILELKWVGVASPAGDYTLLSDISFTVSKGDRLLITGASGAGKTTILRLLNRLISPSRGSIYLANQDYQNIPIINLRQRVVLVPQEPKLLGMTIAQSLAYPLVLQQLKKTEIQRRIDYWYRELNLEEDWLDRNELQLSLGQRQIVSIVRALVMQPEILVLDEPTSALDIGRASRLLEILVDLTNGGQTTVIMVNHQLELAKKFSSRVLYLEKGRIKQNSPAQDWDWQELQDNLIQENNKLAQQWED
jgi:D-methionine transport system ATP-binding protein